MQRVAAGYAVQADDPRAVRDEQERGVAEALGDPLEPGARGLADVEPVDGGRADPEELHRGRVAAVTDARQPASVHHRRHEPVAGRLLDAGALRQLGDAELSVGREALQQRQRLEQRLDDALLVVRQGHVGRVRHFLLIAGGRPARPSTRACSARRRGMLPPARQICWTRSGGISASSHSPLRTFSISPRCRVDAQAVPALDRAGDAGTADQRHAVERLAAPEPRRVGLGHDRHDPGGARSPPSAGSGDGRSRSCGRRRGCRLAAPWRRSPPRRRPCGPRAGTPCRSS